MPKPNYRIPQPRRLRCIEHSFAWIDHRLLRSGFIQVMTHQDQSLYLFLALAADCNGVSFYRKEKVCDILGLDFGAFEAARDRLINMGLLAFAPYSAVSVNGFHQLLPVDRQPPDFASMSPAAPTTPAMLAPRVSSPTPRNKLPSVAAPPQQGASALPRSSPAPVTSPPQDPAQAWPPSAAELTARLAAAFKTV